MGNRDRLDGLLQDFTDMEKGPAGCALLVTRGDDILYEGYKGFADEAAKRWTDKNTVYRMYSCTKVVTAAAVMLLLERGKILLDDPVWQYLPEYKDLDLLLPGGKQYGNHQPGRDHDDQTSAHHDIRIHL